MSALTRRSNSPPCKAQFEPIVRLSKALALTPASIDIESGAASIHMLKRRRRGVVRQVPLIDEDADDIAQFRVLQRA